MIISFPELKPAKSNHLSETHITVRLSELVGKCESEVAIFEKFICQIIWNTISKLGDSM